MGKQSQKNYFYINMFGCKCRSNVFAGKLVSLDKGWWVILVSLSLLEIPYEGIQLLKPLKQVSHVLEKYSIYSVMSSLCKIYIYKKIKPKLELYTHQYCLQNVSSLGSQVAALSCLTEFNFPWNLILSKTEGSVMA